MCMTLSFLFMLSIAYIIYLNFYYAEIHAYFLDILLY